MRYFLFACLLLWAPAAEAQNDHAELLRDRLETRISAELDAANGVVGLAVRDLSTGDEIVFNGDLVFPQASAIKIPILIELMKRVGEGTVDPAERLEIRSADMVGGAGILQRFEDGGSALSLHDLAVLMIVLSDNAATNLLIERLGMASVNRNMEELGFPDIRLRRRMIDPESSARGDENVATPSAAMQLMARLGEPDGSSAGLPAGVREVLGLPKSSLLFDAGMDRLHNKVGGLGGVDTEWAFVDLPRRPYVIVFMASYGSDASTRAAARRIGALVHAYFSTLARASVYGVQSDPALLPEP